MSEDRNLTEEPHEKIFEQAKSRVRFEMDDEGYHRLVGKHVNGEEVSGDWVSYISISRLSLAEHNYIGVTSYYLGGSTPESMPVEVPLQLNLGTTP
jgi:hypothetical protein